MSRFRGRYAHAGHCDAVVGGQRRPVERHTPARCALRPESRHTGRADTGSGNARSGLQARPPWSRSSTQDIQTSEYRRDYRVGYRMQVLEQARLNLQFGIDAERRKNPVFHLQKHPGQQTSAFWEARRYCGRGRAATLLTHQNRAPAREQCSRVPAKGPPERGAVILWLPAGRRARRRKSQPRRQLRGRRTAGEPPKRLGNRLVGNADTLGDEAIRVAKFTKPSGAWRYRAVHRRSLDPAKGELPGNASAGANAIVAGPPLTRVTC